MTDFSNFEFRRQLFFEKPPATKGEGELVLSIFQHDSKWECRYQLSNIPHVYPNAHTYGVDALQALVLCFRLLKSQFEDAETYGGYTIWWAEPGDFAGLSV